MYNTRGAVRYALRGDSTTGDNLRDVVRPQKERRNASSSRSSEAARRMTRADWEREKEKIVRKYKDKRQTQYSILDYLRRKGWDVG
jgi:hypothetical protein